MIGIDANRREVAGPLFARYRWNLLAEAILENAVVSEVQVDDAVNPQVGVLTLSQIGLSLVGGEAGHPAARRWVQAMAPWTAVVAASPGWDELVQESQGEKLRILPRWAFNSDGLDPARLAAFRDNLPVGFHIQKMDTGLTSQLMQEEGRFSGDHLLNYASQEDFLARGFGFCVLEGERIVSVASTFVTCQKGIEIQINTRESHRGKGLGTAVAAAIMLHSLERGLDPSWDAANEISVGLAVKLGYTLQGTYQMYFLPGEQPED